MQNTDNYGMRLPIRGVDRANVDDLNYNTNIIDGAMFDNRNISLKMYNDNGIAVYNTGDIVGQVNLSGHILAYVCLDDNVSGTWDATKWDITDLSEQIMIAKQSGGATELDELDDVDLTTPSEGQVLTYDGSDWVNADAQGGEVTKTAEGNPIELTDGADAPLVKCTTAITGSQDLHGFDKPWVGGAGKNKLEVTANSQTINGITFTVNSDGTVIANGTATAEADFILIGVSSIQGSYIANGCPTGGSTSTYFLAVQTSGSSWNNRDVGNGVTINDDTIIRVMVTIMSGYTANNLLFKPMLRLATVSDATFAPYSNICPITAYDESTISGVGRNLCDIHITTLSAYEDFIFPKPIDYEITVSVKNNDVVLSENAWRVRVNYYNGEKRYINDNDFPATITPTQGNPIISFTYRGNTMTSGSYDVMCVKGSIPYSYEPYINVDHTATFSSSIYQGNADFVGGTARATWGYIASYNGETLPGEWISSMDEYAPGTTPTTGAQVAYELASPTEETITPTNLPIKSLFGYNHIESSTGEMEIEYITQAQQPLIDLIRAEKGDTYSTSEQIIGKWIDGSILYRRTYEITVQSPSAPYTEDISITGMVVVGIEKHYANYQYSGTWYYESGDQLNGAYLSITQKDETGTALTVSSNMGSGLDAIKLCFSISYIKTSSNNRSLAKGGNEPEEVKEEVKEEPEEVKEEPQKVEEEKEENEDIAENPTR